MQSHNTINTNSIELVRSPFSANRASNHHENTCVDICFLSTKFSVYKTRDYILFPTEDQTYTLGIQTNKYQQLRYHTNRLMRFLACTLFLMWFFVCENEYIDHFKCNHLLCTYTCDLIQDMNLRLGILYLSFLTVECRKSSHFNAMSWLVEPTFDTLNRRRPSRFSYVVWSRQCSTGQVLFEVRSIWCVTSPT